jgi:hypothetical protein
MGALALKAVNDVVMVRTVRITEHFPFASLRLRAFALNFSSVVSLDRSTFPVNLRILP